MSPPTYRTKRDCEETIMEDIPSAFLLSRWHRPYRPDARHEGTETFERIKPPENGNKSSGYHENLRQKLAVGTTFSLSWTSMRVGFAVCERGRVCVEIPCVSWCAELTYLQKEHNRHNSELSTQIEDIVHQPSRRYLRCVGV